MKLTWEKPKLIVLMRGKPEEHLLAGICKEGVMAETEGGPISSFVNCVQIVAPECLICSLLQNS